MKVLEYEFSFICSIEPKKDSEGKCIERRPSSRYAKKHIRKLHGYPEPFCDFSIDKKFTKNSGVYLFVVDRKTKYVGITKRKLRERIMEYGHISGIHCYKNGRETNCRINKKIMDCANKGEVVKLYFLELKNEKQMEDFEEKIKSEIKPPWNK